jgi:electron transfer flavoprotein alpha subunit
MRTIVCIKQVPLVEQMRFDPDAKRLIREGAESEINPFDRRAITAAVGLRRHFGGEVVALTMGPAQARQALAEALAMGCDRGVHLLGPELAGSDTLATARALMLVCRRIGFDFILCGKNSTDAETAQVPPMLAELLDLPQVTGVTQLDLGEDGQSFTAVRERDDGFETLHGRLPALLSAAERLVKPIKVTPDEIAQAQTGPIEVWNITDIGGRAEDVGQAGSPTAVTAVESIQPARKRRTRTVQSNLDQVARDTVRDLLDEGLFAQRGSTTPLRRLPSRESGARDRAIWVVAEADESRLRPVTFELLGRAVELSLSLGGEVAAVLLGDGVEGHTSALAAYGADRVYLGQSPALAAYATEPYVAALAESIRRHDPYAVLIPSTAQGRDLAPRLAARLGVGLTGDCIGLEIDGQGRLVQLKPAFGGHIVARILTRTRPAMATVRPGVFPPPLPDYSRRPALESLPTDSLPENRTRTIKVERSAAAGVEIESAEVVVGVGMGIGGPENLGMISQLAETLGAAVGATRKAVDAGWLPRQVQIGLTGRSISPRLYLAVGVSGKFNHTIGILRAGLVLAINSDPDAPIFEHTDYGIVGDWAEVVPALSQALRQARS